MTSLEYELRGVYKMLEYCKRHPSRIYSMGCEIRNRNGHKMYTPIFSFANCRSLVTKHVEALLGICCFLLGRPCSQLPPSAFNPNAQTHRKLQLAKTGERSREYTSGFARLNWVHSRPLCSRPPVEWQNSLLTDDL